MARSYKTQGISETHGITTTHGTCSDGAVEVVSESISWSIGETDYVPDDEGGADDPAETP